MSETPDSGDIKRRLDVIIALILKQHAKDGMTAREQIMFLNTIGLKDHEIAQIFGKSRGYVAKEISIMKRTVKKKSIMGDKNEL